LLAAGNVTGGGTAPRGGWARDGRTHDLPPWCGSRGSSPRSRNAGTRAGYRPVPASLVDRPRWRGPHRGMPRLRGGLRSAWTGHQSEDRTAPAPPGDSAPTCAVLPTTPSR